MSLEVCVPAICFFVTYNKVFSINADIILQIHVELSLTKWTLSSLCEERSAATGQSIEWWWNMELFRSMHLIILNKANHLT